MIEIIEESKKKNQRPVIKVTIGETEITNDILGISGEKAIENIDGGLTKNTISIQASNINGKNVVTDGGKYSNDAALGKKLKVETGYIKDGVEYLMTEDIGNVYSLSTNERDKTSSLSVIGEKKLSGLLSSDDAYFSLKPFDIVQRIATLIGVTSEVYSKDASPHVDEASMIIDYIGYYRDDLFSELNQLCLYSRGKVIYDEDNNKLIYYTYAYLSDKDENGAVDYHISSEGTDYTLLDSKEEFKTSEIINRLMISTLEYGPEVTGSPVGLTEKIKIEAGGTEKIRYRYQKDIYGKNITYTILVENLDGTTGTSTLINVVKTEFGGGVEFDITNNDVTDFLITLDLSGDLLIPTKNSLQEDNDESITENGLKSKSVSNKYFQNTTYSKIFAAAYFELYTANLSYYSASTVGMPQLKLLDKVKFTDTSIVGNKVSKQGLVNRIKWEYNLTKGYQYLIELFNVHTVQACFGEILENLATAENLIYTEIEEEKLRLLEVYAQGCKDYANEDIFFADNKIYTTVEDSNLLLIQTYEGCKDYANEGLFFADNKIYTTAIDSNLLLTQTYEGCKDFINEGIFFVDNEVNTKIIDSNLLLTQTYEGCKDFINEGIFFVDNEINTKIVDSKLLLEQIF